MVDTDMPVLGQPAMVRVVGNIAPDEEPSGRMPGGTFRPEHSGVEALYGGACDLILCETLVERDDVGFRVTDGRGIRAVVALLRVMTVSNHSGLCSDLI